MSDFDPAETIVSADQLAHALEIEPARILELISLGILHPLGSDVPHRYEFLESLRAFLRHLRAQIHKEN